MPESANKQLFWTIVNTRTNYIHRVTGPNRLALFKNRNRAIGELARLKRLGEDHYRLAQVEVREVHL